MKKTASIYTVPLAAVILLAPNWVNADAEKQAAGTVFQDCDSCPEMVVVHPGTFMMGDDKSRPTRDRTTPIHQVTIAYPFAVGRFEITFDEWDACVDDGGCKYRPTHLGWEKKDHRHTWGRSGYPVFKVSWFSVQTYLKWLNRKTDGGYRLLSEAEWEYMARAGTTTTYHTGDTITDEQANFTAKGTHYSNKKGDWEKKTVPVGSYPPNAFGIYDVHGNVSELVADCYHSNYDGAPNDGSVWESGSACNNRTHRGGTWSNRSRVIHSATRGGGYSNSFFTTSSGFRVAKSLKPMNDDK